MKIACITLLAAGAFAVQDTTPPVISLNLMGMGRHSHYADDEHNNAAKSFKITAKSSAGTECIRTSTVGECPLPKCEVHDHHDHAIECNPPTITRVRDQPATVNDADFPLDDDLNRHRLGQYLLEYNAKDSSGNEADTVTFSFLFIDPFQPNFSNFLQDEANNGFSRFGLPGYPKGYFDGNVNRHASDFEAFGPDKTYARVCNPDTTNKFHAQAAVCRATAKECEEEHFQYKDYVAKDKRGELIECKPGNVVNTKIDKDENVVALTSAQLTAGEHSFFKYGSKAAESVRTGRTSWQYNFGAVVNDKNHGADKENQTPGKAYYTAATLQVYVSVNGGTFTKAEDGPTIDTRTSGYQTIDYYVEDGADAYGYKQVNNPQVHRVELEFFDQIKPKIYLKCYKNTNTYTQHVRGDKHDGRHRANNAGNPSPFEAGVTDGSDCISKVSDGSNDVNLCKGDACKFSTEGSKAAVTLECDRDQANVEPADNEDVYVEPGMWVLDNVDSWQSADTLKAEECASASCANGRLEISPSAEVQKTWTSKVGEYTVTYKAEDTTGNAADEVTRTVNVVDRFAPTLKLQGDTQVQNSAGAAVNNLQKNVDKKNTFAGWEGEDGLFDHSYHQANANGLNNKGGFTCTDSCSTKANLKIEISLYQGAKCNDDGTVADAADVAKTQIGKVNDWQFPEYVTGSYAIHYKCEDESANWAEACREVLNVDHTRPIIQILGSNDMTLEATHQGNYIDDGATCSDQVDGVISQNVEVSGDVVNLSKVGLYKIQYNCKDNADRAATMAERKVRVEQTSCPTCKVEGCDEATGCSMYHEASFAYTDSGAKCSDVIDGDITAECVTCNNEATNCDMKAETNDAVKRESCNVPTLISSDKIGTYYITYVAQNTVNKWNYDDDCRGKPTKYVRTVIVQDTLKPVITLKYGKDENGKDKVVAQGQVSTKSLAKYDATHPNEQDQSSRTTVARNAAEAEGPGYHYRGATNPKESKHYDDFTKQTLMAEETSSGVNGWVLGAIASAVTGLALLGYSQRKTTVATSVPV